MLLSYFALRDLPALLAAAHATGLTDRTTVHVGTYGVNRNTADAVHKAECRYAPIIALRNVAPPARRLAAMTSAQRVAAGRAAGRNFRDRMRSPLFEVDAWQFDELSRAVARSRPLREFARGMLDALLRGRPGDPLVRGFVWMSEEAVGLPSLPIDEELQHFWESLEAAARQLVGEEFPVFAGNPAAAARAEDSRRRALEAGGPIRRHMASVYTAGITPGFRLAPGLGGNVNHRSRTFVNRWRNAYLSARRAAGVHDFAAFNFRFGNASPQVMHDVLAALARVV